MRTRLAATITAALAVLAGIPDARALEPALLAAPAGLVAPALAAAALEEPPAPPATPFEVIHRRAHERRSQRLALYTALAGVALVATSFPLSDEADRRYEKYLVELDVSRMDEHFRGAQRMDRYSAAALLTGEVLLATAVWLRFVHEPRRQRVALDLRPDRCGVALRF